MMKKLFLLLLSVPLLVLMACSTKDEPSDPNGTGSISITPSVDLEAELIKTYAGDDFVGYSVKITGEANSYTLSKEISASGDIVIDNIPKGSYKVELISYTQMPAPEFDTPVYGGEATGVVVSENTETPVTIECTQANSGIYFIFDASLEGVGGFTNVIPTIEDAKSRSLKFDVRSTETIAGNSVVVSKRGYFAPGDVTLSLKDGETPIAIEGDFSQTLTFEAKQLWEVMLKSTPVAGGGQLKVIATITKIDQPNVSKQFEVGIAPAYALKPTNGEQNVYVDTYLDMVFGSAPTLGTSGTIAIYKKDGTLVDEIKLEDEYIKEKDKVYNSTKINFLGVIESGRMRAVNYEPVVVRGNTARIVPHSGALEYDTEYYVTVDAGVIVADNFSAIASNVWNFKTKTAAPSLTATTITVDGKGGADFITIQAAIDHACRVGKDAKVEVFVKNGIYEEMLFLRGKNNLTIRGESKEGTIIRYANSDGLNPGVGGSAAKPEFGVGNITLGGRPIFLIESVSMSFENLTIENNHIPNGAGDQAETIYFNSTNGTLTFVNCNLISRQDTINIKGYCWFYNCMIEGDVDFIWGGAEVALFENSEIRSATSGGYILQARVPTETAKGFVFLNCELTKLTGVAAGTTYLARSGYSSTYYDNIALINCKMDDHIATQGWREDAGKSPNPAVATSLSGWKEYGTTDLAGNPYNVSGRLTNVQYQLTESEYEAGYKTREQIMEAYVANNPSKNLSWMRLPN